MYEVILYYKFNRIEDPETFCEEHKHFCKELGVKGRIYIGEEGINGTLGGTPEQVARYKEHLTSIPGFDGIDFKTDTSDYVPFAKLKCKTRDELVAIHKDGVDPAEGGKYLEPEEWKQVMESEEVFRPNATVHVDLNSGLVANCGDIFCSEGFCCSSVAHQVDNVVVLGD
jgi:UPF0176 protein